VSITNKTRKILWGRSGSRCALCRNQLVVGATSVDNESVVGDECHIVSGQSNGPRHELDLPKNDIDSYENLILLCRVHHKMVDDQTETYTADVLRRMKSNHEQWVSEKLTDKETPAPVRLRRVKENVPKCLPRLHTGRDILSLVEGSYASQFGHDDLKTVSEVEKVADFLQFLQDFVDIGDSLEAGDRVRLSFEVEGTLKELEDMGFLVFGDKEIQILEGGINPPSNWPVAIVYIARHTNSASLTNISNN